MYWHPLERNGAFREVETDSLVRKNLAFLNFVRSAQYGVNSGDELIWEKWFHEIVIRPVIETVNLILRVSVSGNHYNRHLGFSLLPEPFDDIEPISVTQRQVNDIELRLRVAIFHEVIVSEKRGCRESMIPEFFSDFFRENFLVVNNGHVHTVISGYGINKKED